MGLFKVYIYLNLALLAVGATLGALSGGPILQRMTIRKALIFTDVIGLIGSLLSQVVNIYVLCISRFIIGLAVGQNCTLVFLVIKLLGTEIYFRIYTITLKGLCWLY